MLWGGRISSWTGLSTTWTCSARRSWLTWPWHSWSSGSPWRDWPADRRAGNQFPQGLQGRKLWPSCIRSQAGVRTGANVSITAPTTFCAPSVTWEWGWLIPSPGSSLPACGPCTPMCLLSAWTSLYFTACRLTDLRPIGYQALWCTGISLQLRIPFATCLLFPNSKSAVTPLLL